MAIQPDNGSPYQKALAFLESYILQSDALHREKLPAYKALAEMAGTAPSTMLKAVRYMRDKGILLVSHGKGIMLNREIPFEIPLPRKPPSAKRSNAETISRRLFKDIHEGNYSSNPVLPSMKELGELYGCCYRTMQQSLEILKEKRVIEPHRRSFRIKRNVPGSGTNTIVIVGRGDSFGEFLISNSRSWESLRALETICVQKRLRLHRVTCAYSGTELTGLDEIRTIINSPAKKQNVIGFLVSSLSLEPEFLHALLKLLHASKKPVALFDETFNAGIPPECQASNLFSHFMSAQNEKDGGSVAQYLLENGHRNIAYIHSPSRSYYAEARRAGIERQLRESGMDIAYQCFVPDLKNTETPDTDTDGYAQLLTPHLPGFRPDAESSFSVVPRVYEKVFDQMAIAHSNQHFRTSFFSYLKKAISPHDFTAWIACNDAMALHCLDYLAQEGVAVPENVSVVGFDDSQEAFLGNLTSYSFNGLAYMHAAINHLLAPPKRKGPQPVYIEGSVKERGSSSTTVPT